MLNELLFRLLTEDHRETLIQFRDKLNWMAQYTVDDGDGVSKDLLRLVLMFHTKFSKCPNIESLRTYLYQNPDHDDWIVHRTQALSSELDFVLEYEPENSGSDIDVLLSNALDRVRSDWHAHTFQYAALIASGAAAKNRRRDGTVEVGPEAAKAFLRTQWARDYIEVPPELAGVWQENTEAIQQRLDDYLNSKKNRVKLGFGRIDAEWVIRYGKSVIIAGSSGDGKSTFLNSAVYNMARRGERILYVSLEFSPEEIWEFLAFLHVRRFQGRFYLPSLAQWQQHTPEAPTITPEHRRRMGLVIEDIQRRTSVSGIIDVQRFFTLDDIVSYYEANKAKHRYTVVVIDYIGRLNIDVGQYQKEKEIRDQLARRAVAWCAKENAFVLISPSQVNRESHKAQKKNKEGGYDLDALFNASALQHDIDLAMSVYSDDDLKSLGEIQVKCLKWRGTNRFPMHELKFDFRTKFVFDPNDSEKNEPPMSDVYEDEFLRKSSQKFLTGDELKALLGAEEVVQ